MTNRPLAGKKPEKTPHTFNDVLRQQSLCNGGCAIFLRQQKSALCDRRGFK
jgi:hypothetical protein